MKIGILIAGPIADALQPTYGDYGKIYAEFLQGHGFSFRSFFVFDGDVPDDPSLCDGWIITGSKFGAYEDHPWIPPLEALIRNVHAAKRPLVGICFGHQIIAQALGGQVEKYEGGWAAGRTEYRGADGMLTLNAWHQDQVVAVPPNATVLARNAFCQNAVLLIGESTLTYQPHPEFGVPYLSDLIEHRGYGIVPDSILAQAKADLHKHTDNEAIAAKISAFFASSQVPA